MSDLPDLEGKELDLVIEMSCEVAKCCGGAFTEADWGEFLHKNCKRARLKIAWIKKAIPIFNMSNILAIIIDIEEIGS